MRVEGDDQLHASHGMKTSSTCNPHRLTTSDQAPSHDYNEAKHSVVLVSVPAEAFPALVAFFALISSDLPDYKIS